MKKVFVGMSGGVDSSAAAALLQKKGYEVTGVFIKTDLNLGSQDCTWRDERRDAMRVAAKLGIPFATLDLTKEYQKEVVDYLLREYKAGRTPNPDVMCNREIKFGAFYRKARQLGADFVATGHYARLDKGQLKMAKDDNKDQTYFLWTLTKEILEHTLFPIGNYLKPDVRKLAKKFALPTAAKKDSQGVCFIGQLDMDDFLRQHIKAKKGNILNEKGEIIGQHDGVWFYTIGQRHGFVVSSKSPTDAPYYVVAKDVKRNTITVSHQAVPKTEANKEISLTEVNWTLNKLLDLTKKYRARLRYRQLLQPCRLKIIGKTVKVIFDQPQIAAPGQSCVIYAGPTCLGGGVIV